MVCKALIANFRIALLICEYSNPIRSENSSFVVTYLEIKKYHSEFLYGKKEKVVTKSNIPWCKLCGKLVRLRKKIVVKLDHYKGKDMWHIWKLKSITLNFSMSKMKKFVSTSFISRCEPCCKLIRLRKICWEIRSIKR